MGKTGRDRGSRRRFDHDDAFGAREVRYEPLRQSFRRTPREDAAPSGPPVDATVKWFNDEKGFGFVELGDGSGDAFLHIGVLQSAGHDVVAPATRLRVHVLRFSRSMQAELTRDNHQAGVLRRHRSASV
jgi:cold shock protein